MLWQISQEMLALAMELQRNHCIYAIGNLPQPGFSALQRSLEGLELFKKIFVVSELGASLPHSGILTKALQAAKLDLERTFYIGDHIDSVITARSFGFHAIKCGDRRDCIQHVVQICHESIVKAKAWLRGQRPRPLPRARPRSPARRDRRVDLQSPAHTRVPRRNPLLSFPRPLPLRRLASFTQSAQSLRSLWSRASRLCAGEDGSRWGCAGACGEADCRCEVWSEERCQYG